MFANITTDSRQKENIMYHVYFESRYRLKY